MVPSLRPPGRHHIVGGQQTNSPQQKHKSDDDAGFSVVMSQTTRICSLVFALILYICARIFRARVYVRAQGRISLIRSFTLLPSLAHAHPLAGKTVTSSLPPSLPLSRTHALTHKRSRIPGLWERGLRNFLLSNIACCRRHADIILERNEAQRVTIA